MALPAQAIEKMIRQPSETQGAFRQLLFLSVAIFIILLIIYAGLSLGYKNYLNVSSNKMEQKIKDLGKDVSEVDVANVESFYSQLYNLKTLLNAHRVPSQAFSLLERTVMPGVYYNSVSFNSATNELSLNGGAKSAADVAAEGTFIENQPEVDRINLSTVAAGATGAPWQFKMSVFLKKEVTQGGLKTITGNSSSTQP